MFKQLINKFVKEEKGAPIIELVILIAMSAIIAAFLFPQLRKNLGIWFTSMTSNLNKGIGGTTGGVTTGTGAGVGGASGWGSGTP